MLLLVTHEHAHEHDDSTRLTKLLEGLQPELRAVLARRLLLLLLVLAALLLAPDGLGRRQQQRQEQQQRRQGRQEGPHP